MTKKIPEITETTKTIIMEKRWPSPDDLAIKATITPRELAKIIEIMKFSMIQNTYKALKVVILKIKNKNNGMPSLIASIKELAAMYS